MPLVGLALEPFALYVTTGMPAASALLMGAMNEVAETTVVAMPGEPAVTAAWKADSMVGTVDWVDRARSRPAWAGRAARRSPGSRTGSG